MDELDRIKALRAAGVKAASFDGDKLVAIEFFPQPTVGGMPLVTDEFGKLEPLDTLIPPVNPGDGEEDNAPLIPPALDRVLRRGSVS